MCGEVSASPRPARAARPARPAARPARAHPLPPATRQSAFAPAPGFRRAQAPRRCRAELEGADLATDDPAFHVADPAARRPPPVGQDELAELAHVPGQALETDVYPPTPPVSPLPSPPPL